MLTHLLLKSFISTSLSPTLEFLVATMILCFLLTVIFSFSLYYSNRTPFHLLHCQFSLHSLSLCLSSLLTHFCVHISAGELTDGHSLMSQDFLLYPDSHVINKIGLFLLYAPLKPYHHAFRFLPHNFSDMHFFLQGKCGVHFR